MRSGTLFVLLALSPTSLAAAECALLGYVLPSKGQWVDRGQYADQPLGTRSRICAESRIHRLDPQPDDTLRIALVNGERSEIVCADGHCNAQPLNLDPVLASLKEEPRAPSHVYERTMRYAEQRALRSVVILENHLLDPTELDPPEGFDDSRGFAWCLDYAAGDSCPDHPERAATDDAGRLAAPRPGLHLLKPIIELPNKMLAYGPESAWVLVLPEDAADLLAEISKTLADFERDGAPHTIAGPYLARFLER